MPLRTMIQAVAACLALPATGCSSCSVWDDCEPGVARPCDDPACGTCTIAIETCQDNHEWGPCSCAPDEDTGWDHGEWELPGDLAGEVDDLHDPDDPDAEEFDAPADPGAEACDAWEETCDAVDAGWELICDADREDGDWCDEAGESP